MLICVCWMVLFLSTLSLRRATTAKNGSTRSKRNFYPRSPCGERLDKMSQPGCAVLFLSTLSLRRATDISFNIFLHHTTFLSTLSLRRATLPLIVCVLCVSYFYPRSPCGERHFRCSVKCAICRIKISIHALLAESDTIVNNIIFMPGKFLSTLSLRRATLAGPSGPAFLFNFYPRSPCGERRL